MTEDRPDLWLGEPGLRRLITTLTSGPTPGELAGQQAALMMFKSARRAPALARWRTRLGGRLAAAAAALALVGGFTAAGYASVLPAPLQHVAHRILGFAGVPDFRRPAAPIHSHSATAPARDGAARTPGSHARSVSPSAPPSSPSSPGAPTTARLTATAAHLQIAAGGSVVITALLTDRGQARLDAQVSLMELPAGQSTWQLAAHAVTGAGGQAVLTVRGVATNASFRVTGPGATASALINIVVTPPLSVRIILGQHRKSDVLTVGCQFSQPGDVVELQTSAAGQWLTVRTRRLGKTGHVAFTLSAHRTRASYRVVLLATAAHGQSVSGTVTAPPSGHPGNR